MERNYDFRQKLSEVHKPNRRNDAVCTKIQGTFVDSSWEIVYSDGADRVIRNVAMDLREYFEVSMDVYPKVVPVSRATDAKKIILNTDYEGEKSAFRVAVSADGITVSGADPRGTAQGCYFIEDTMNLNEGPVMAEGVTEKKPLYSPRMVHSGFSLDVFPDAHLRTLAHNGIDAILVYTKDVNITHAGPADFNDLIYRAAGFGIDVYAYSLHKNYKHPLQEGAREFFRDTYGKLFRQCPGLRGIVFVGEACDFPSRDDHTTGVPRHMIRPELHGKVAFNKRWPGWYPCYDYADLMTAIRDAIRAENPEADVVLWSYNWGWAPKEARQSLIRSLPKDISLLVTYEMHEPFKMTETVTERTTDYTIWQEGPGQYFVSEAEEAARSGIRLYTMSNTGGRTWDLGVVPYVPAPYQWKKRWDGLRRAHDDWGLSGLMDSHHYGFYPSFISELMKASAWEPVVDFDAHIRALAVRDFGEENADAVLKAWAKCSDGIRHCISTNEDQYGPFRIGPAYPLLLTKMVQIPKSSPFAIHGGNEICNPMYNYNIAGNGMDKILYEIDSITEMERLFREGADILAEILPTLPEAKLDDANRMYGLVRFFQYSAATTVNVKNWYLLKMKLGFKRNVNMFAGDQVYDLDREVFDAIPAEERRSIILEMQKIAEAEIANAERTIPLVEIDSRLGFEPTMDYMCDRPHLEWKINIVKNVLKADLLPLLNL